MSPHWVIGLGEWRIGSSEREALGSRLDEPRVEAVSLWFNTELVAYVLSERRVQGPEVLRKPTPLSRDSADGVDGEEEAEDRVGESGLGRVIERETHSLHLLGDLGRVFLDRLAQLSFGEPADADPVGNVQAGALATVLDGPNHFARQPGPDELVVQFEVQCDRLALVIDYGPAFGRPFGDDDVGSCEGHPLPSTCSFASPPSSA